MSPAPRFTPFVVVFTAFALLFAGGNVLAELSPNLTLARVRSTILLSAVFAIPALWLFLRYDFRTAPPLAARYWQLCWSFAFVAYALHAYFSVAVWFGWDFPQIEDRQTRLVAWTNYALLGLWFIDALVAVTGPGYHVYAVRLLRWGTHLLFVVTFVTASLVFRNELRTMYSYVGGVLVVLAVVTALALRWPVAKPAQGSS